MDTCSPSFKRCEKRTCPSSFQRGTYCIILCSEHIQHAGFCDSSRWCRIPCHLSRTATTAEMISLTPHFQPAAQACPAVVASVLVINRVSLPWLPPSSDTTCEPTTILPFGQQRQSTGNGTLARMSARALPSSSSFPGSTLRVRLRGSSATAFRRKAARGTASSRHSTSSTRSYT